MVENLIDIIIKNMSIKNASLHNKLKKKFNKRDIAILELLSNGNSILFISDASTRTKLYNAFSTLELEYLICDFEEDITDESFLDYVIEDSNLTTNYDVNILIDKKKDLDLKLAILTTPYSNFQLFPADLKSKRDYYFKKLNHTALIYPMENIDKYNNSSARIISENLKKIVENYEDVFIFKQYISYDFFNSEEYKSLILIHTSFKKYLNEFINLNNRLNKVLGIKKFNDLIDVEFLENSFVLDLDNVYIDEEDCNELNEILKQYFKDSSIDLESNDIINKYSNGRADFLENISNNIKFTELLDNHIYVDDEKADNLSLLKDRVFQLVDIARFLKKQLHILYQFYSKYPYFQTNESCFNQSNNLNKLTESYDSFCKDFDRLNKYKEFLEYKFVNDDEKFFADLVSSKKIDKNIVSDAFYFNIFDYHFNNFLDEYTFIDKSNLKVEDYKFEIDAINQELGESTFDQYINNIKSYPIHFNKDEKILKQKEDLIKMMSNDDCESIMDILKEFKELILVNRRVFLVDEESLKKLSLINYTREFDYILKNDEITINKK